MTQTEIGALEARGNVAANWSDVRVADDFRTDAVVGCHFIGRCYLGRFDRDVSSAGMPEGVYHSTIVDSTIDAGASVHRCPEVRRYRICSGAQVVGSLLRCGPETCFANGTTIEPGIETGGRSLTLLVDLDLNTVVHLCRRMTDASADGVAQAIATYVSTARAQAGYVGPRAIVRGCSAIEDAWLGPNILVDGAARLERVCVLSSSEEPVEIGAGVIVRDSLIQEGCSVTDGGLVDSSLMLEHSHVERHGKLTTSVLGPNSGVAEGEATACVIGPFTAFHHQALLIAAFWPAGKGNVGYGANIGSNHTSRLPDQEVWPGEGMFFGLGCNVKFPADFSRAPYSIISTGVTTLPQRMEIPFSVITTPTVHTTAAPGIMQLLPGWVLRENLYALIRNEAKYRKRNKARRTSIELAVFRADIVELMRKAREYLAAVGEQKNIYLPGDIAGIGKNFVTDRDRRRGIEVFDRYIRYHELAQAAAPLLEGESSGALSDAQRRALEGYLEHRRIMIADARASREKDWRRGIACIEDYAETHPTVDQDEVILYLEKEYTGQESLLEQLIRVD